MYEKNTTEKRMDVWTICGIIGLVIGVPLLIIVGHDNLVVDPEIRRIIADERDMKLVAYLNEIDARFQNDEALDAETRIIILKEDHRLNADQLGKITLIQNDYQEQINATWNNDSRLNLHMLGLASSLFGFFTIVLRRL